MGLTAAKCSGCGASIQVDDSRREGYCPFCGTKYVTQDIIHNTVNNSYVTNNIGTAIVQNGDSAETLFERLEAFCKVGDLYSAEETVIDMRKRYPQRAITWYGSVFYEAAVLSDRLPKFREEIDRRLQSLRFPAPQELLKTSGGNRSVFSDTREAAFQRVARVVAGVRENWDLFHADQTEFCAFCSKNAADALCAARKVETDDERSRFADVAARAEEAAAECAKKAKAFEEYAAAAFAEIEARAEAWKQSAEEFLNGAYGHRNAVGTGGARRKLLIAFGAVVLIAAAVLAVWLFLR